VKNTLTLARTNGAGVVLTDGTDRWRVSDWSMGTRQVFGHLHRDGAWTAYGRLPAKTRLETPAEEAAADVAAYGESVDPTVRTRRRKKGMDGLRDDVHDLSEPFRERVQAIAEEVRLIAAEMVRVRLRELEARFSRHRFTAISESFVAASLEVTPPMRHISTHPTSNIGDKVCRDGWLHMPLLPKQDVAAYIHRIEREIAYILVTFSDEFGMDVGVVSTDDATENAEDAGSVTAI
jgi:hypothetical protein